jgi:nicotinate-nucleotide adenylyltransferase
MKHVAVFGGTFDPPTRAHEAIVAACLDRPDIDEVWWMPSGQRQDKPGMISNTGRLAMLQLIKTATFADDERLIITDFEQRLPQPTRTYQTVAALEARYPDHAFRYVFGGDAYRDMPKWRHGPELQRSLGVLVVPRVGCPVPPETDTVQLLPLSLGEPISSTMLRERQSNGEQIEGYVSSAVAGYIAEQALYREVTV